MIPEEPSEEFDAWLNSPVCSSCGCHPEEGEDHDDECEFWETGGLANERT